MHALIVWGLGFEVWGVWLRVQVLGFRIQGLAWVYSGLSYSLVRAHFGHGLLHLWLRWGLLVVQHLGLMGPEFTRERATESHKLRP